MFSVFSLYPKPQTLNQLIGTGFVEHESLVAAARSSLCTSSLFFEDFQPGVQAAVPGLASLFGRGHQPVVKVNLPELRPFMTWQVGCCLLAEPPSVPAARNAGSNAADAGNKDKLAKSLSPKPRTLHTTLNLKP